MKVAVISLTPTESNPLGVIGEVPDGKGGMLKGHMLVDVMAMVAKFPDAQNVLIQCAGPGGDVEVGDQIYDYLQSLKAEGKKVSTATVGDIGSIMTKVFLVGDEREIREEDKFYVHAPWVPHLEGNASQISKGLRNLYEDENKLLDFYKSKTGINEAGMKGLMSGTTDQDGTFMNADQAVALKFATRKATSKIKAYALIKNQHMSKETQTLGQKLGALIDMALGNNKASSKALELPAGGTVISVSSEDPANLVGADATTTDATGAVVPAPDGEHKLDDGRVLVVAGGKVKEVKAAAAAQAPAPAPAQAATPAPDANAAMAAELASVKAELATLKAAQPVNVDEKIAAAMNEIKNTISGGKTPPKGFNNTGGTGKKEKELSPIQLAMRKTE